MTIKVLKNKTKAIKEFGDKEWNLANIEHYGKPVNWEIKKFRIVAFSDLNDVYGSLGLEIAAGVAHINSIIVSSKSRRKGVGKSLMEEAEKVARENNAHKIFLETGEKWVATKFYNNLGYELTGRLDNHNFHQDFVIYTKILN